MAFKRILVISSSLSRSEAANKLGSSMIKFSYYLPMKIKFEIVFMKGKTNN